MQPASSDATSLSAGDIAGVVLGCILMTCLVIAAVWYFRSHRTATATAAVASADLVVQYEAARPEQSKAEQPEQDKGAGLEDRANEAEEEDGIVLQGEEESITDVSFV
eukprot:TRINITY_DN11417_c0_g3_i1.p3 TRINITY_DN11417_c0_g3~~TRINITY_DN11417_c0_g3_i1.p3  ORF type:complete len:108 (+),score=22.37 TRINITY_DN11417_c0_g3_i1:1095-1418(+)